MGANEESSDEVKRHTDAVMPRQRNKSRSFTNKCIGWFFVTLVLMVLIFSGNLLRKRGPMPSRQTIYNAKQLYLVLMDFEADYGTFPDDASAAKNPSLNRFTGDYSNDYLGQLIAGGYTKDEAIFHASDSRYENGPDDQISPPSRILEKNECGFAYVLVEEKGKRRGLNSEDHGGFPILAAPLVNESGVFEKNSYDKHGVYLRVDGSVRSERLRSSDQKIKLPTGETLFDVLPGSMWGELKPIVLLPDQ